jgi:hypothetical protein
LAENCNGFAAIKYVDRPTDGVAQRSRVTQDDPFPASGCKLRHTLRTGGDQDFLRVVFTCGTWCTMVCRVFSWERFAPERFDISTLEEICAQNFARDVQPILADISFQFQKGFSETNVRGVIRFFAYKAWETLRGLQSMFFSDHGDTAIPNMAMVAAMRVGYRTKTRVCEKLDCRTKMGYPHAD